MKKTSKLFSAVAISAILTFTLNAQSISITNTFGGDPDNLAGTDFLVFDKDGDKEDVHVADRLQLDVTSEHIDSRVRLDFDSSADKSGRGTNVRTRGYVNLRPVEPLNIIAGNAFFTKWAMDQGYLAAFDDNLDNSKLCGSNGAALLFNMAGLQLAAGAGYESKLNLNFGLNYTMEDLFAIGATAQNMTDTKRSVTAYAGLLAVENLTVNAGYSYHKEEDDYLSSCEHGAILSVAYTFADLGLTLAADGLFDITGKKYDSDADEVVDNTDDEGNKFNAFSAAVFASYGINDNLTIMCRSGVTNDLTNSLTWAVYPFFEYGTTLGTFSSGVRFLFDEDDGFSGFSIPFTWKYKFKIM